MLEIICAELRSWEISDTKMKVWDKKNNKEEEEEHTRNWERIREEWEIVLSSHIQIMPHKYYPLLLILLSQK